MILVLLGALGTLGLTGCVVSGRVHAGATVEAEPTLVEVSPGVWVIEDYSEPVFYSENSYWLYRDGIWFRSHVHTGNWVRVSAAPHVVVRVGRPHAYVRSRARAGTRVRTGPRGSVRRYDGDRGGRVRDHRGNSGYGHSRRDAAHDRRDHRREAREDRREHRQDARNDRREHRQDARDDRREHRQDAREDRREEKQERREERREDRSNKGGNRSDHRRHR
jgi:hypothetical protein